MSSQVSVIQLLRSLIISIKGGATEQEVMKEYFEVTGERVPFREMGFSSVEHLLSSFPNEFRVTGSAFTEKKYQVVIKESSAHISRLVASQQSKKKKGQGGSRSFLRRPKAYNFWTMQSKMIRSFPSVSAPSNTLSQRTVNVFNEGSRTYEKINVNNQPIAIKRSSSIQRHMNVVASSRSHPTKSHPIHGKILVYNEVLGKYVEEGETSSANNSRPSDHNKKDEASNFDDSWEDECENFNNKNDSAQTSPKTHYHPLATLTEVNSKKFNEALIKQMQGIKVSIEKPRLTNVSVESSFEKPMDPKLPITYTNPIRRALGLDSLRKLSSERFNQRLMNKETISSGSVPSPKEILKCTTSKVDATENPANIVIQKQLVDDIYEVVRDWPHGIFLNDLPNKYEKKFSNALTFNVLENVIQNNLHRFELVELVGNTSLKIVYSK